MTRALIYTCAIAVAASLAGCRSTGEVEYAGEVRVTSPELVAIGPGLDVVADADEPLFFAGGVYWLYRDGYWFRAGDYRGDFVRVDFAVVPEQLRGLQRPETYAHYRDNLGRARQARPSPTRTRSQQETQQPSQTPAAPPPAPTPEPALPSQSPSEPADPHAPHQRSTPGPTPGANPSQPTTPPGNSAPVQPGETSPPVDQPDRATPPPATNTDDRTDPADESKRLDEKKDPNTTDE